MGENMSKRLKLISATEAEMEERSFSNPYPDREQGVLPSSSAEDSDFLDADGKVGVVVVLLLYSLKYMLTAVSV